MVLLENFGLHLQKKGGT